MNNLQRACLHVALWALILVLFIYIGSRSGNLANAIVIFLYFGLINIAVFYINYLYILPNYLNSRRYIGCALSIILLIVSAAMVKYVLASSFREIVLVRGPNRDYYVSFWEYTVVAAFTGAFFVFISTAFKFAGDWFQNEKVRKNLENEKLSAELAFLKSQINPHFLFNSLNNIYSLAYQRSERTPTAILKLSEIMRYMLQDSNEPTVPLEREISYLQNYIELQKLRFGDGTFVDFQYSGVDDKMRIIPLVLIAFVENCFKHGIVTDEAVPLEIRLQVKDYQMTFEIRNKKNLQNKDNLGGIGLSNVQRRLELSYPGAHELHIENGSLIYYCKLVLHL
ncbi:MAG: sensor histidine kinase [Arcticibacter sp.]